MRTLALFVGVLLLTVDNATAQRDTYEQEPILYSNSEADDAVARLAKQLEQNPKKLAYDERFGYLPAILQSLGVPASSQTLVFSKTSLQLHRISPHHPRALYFNDDVYVGYCHRGDVIELAATDPELGAVFYTMSQKSDSPALIKRDSGNCLSCHASHRTQGVPGYVMRSVFPDDRGQPRLSLGTHTTEMTSEFDQRWGGWYVTGDDDHVAHMGNLVWGESEDDASPADFRGEDYLSEKSDIVTLMVLGHQTQMHNAIAAANFETRRAVHQSREMNKLLGRDPDYLSESAQRRINAAADQVLEHLLMVDETELPDRITGDSDFARDFRAAGKRDSRGRSLRDFDLETRLFKYPCSYLIYSDAFEELPTQVKSVVVERLTGILEGEDDSEDYDHLTSRDRDAILTILRATHADFR